MWPVAHLPLPSDDKRQTTQPIADAATDMDITKFVVSGRDSALLYGDYATYQGQLAKKLLNSRKKLGIATKNRGKFSKKGDVTAAQIGENHAYVALYRSMLAVLLIVPDTSTCCYSRASAPGPMQWLSSRRTPQMRRE